MAGEESEYGIAIFKDVMVPMRDGVRLGTDIHRPALNGEVAPGKYQRRCTVSTQQPVVVRWGDVPLDMTSIVGKFNRSEFNAFYTDPGRGMSMGHWSVEEGYEDYGMFPQTEIFYIVEGTATVQTDDSEYTVGPGDTVFAIPGRRLRLLVKEPMKAFYVCSGAEDIVKTQEVRRQAAEQGTGER